MLTAIAILIFVTYSILIYYYNKSWLQIPFFNANAGNVSTRVTVIIPARNEEKNIAVLLEALTRQTYPAALTEIIVVNDFSTDNTAAIAASFSGVKVVNVTEQVHNSFKKKALETGVAAASGSFIITTDADCVPGPDWLYNIIAFKEKNSSVFIAAPVYIQSERSIVSIFQSLDFMVLQGITAASVYKKIHSMCNGANMGYERKVFYEVNGYAGIDHIASGDDMLLMHKIWKRYPGKVHYLKSKAAIVPTQAMPNWKSFFNQRIRWASKAAYYDDKRIIAVLGIVYLTNLIFPVFLIAAFFNFRYGLLLIGFMAAKTLVEWPFIQSVATFFKANKVKKYFALLQPLHIGYTVISGFLGQVRKYEWKGRIVK